MFFFFVLLCVVSLLCASVSSSALFSYQVDTLDMRTQTWRTHDFSTYDVVYHVAGIAHADVGQVTEEEKKQYYRVNTDLAVETAEKAKKEACSSFSLCLL